MGTTTDKWARLRAESTSAMRLACLALGLAGLALGLAGWALLHLPAGVAETPRLLAPSPDVGSRQD